jgi:hypothetical protein
MPWVKLKPAPKGRVDPGQLRAGIRMEMEHTGDRKAAEIIARQHLHEHRDYYRALTVMEKFLKGKG